MSEAQQHRTGRPPYKPTADTRRLVEILAGLATPQILICRELTRLGHPITSINTLKKHFAAELESGRARMVTSLAVKLHALAMIPPPPLPPGSA